MTAPMAAYGFCMLCQDAWGTPEKKAAIGWYCSPCCRAVTSVAGLAAWKLRILTVQPIALAAACSPWPSLPHCACSHWRNSTVLPLGGADGSGVVTGMVAGMAVAAWTAACAALTVAGEVAVPDAEPDEVPAAEGVLELDAELHAARARTPTARMAPPIFLVLT